MKLLLLFGAIVYFSYIVVQAKPQELITANVQENGNENTKENVNENVKETVKENETKDLSNIKEHFSYVNGYFTHSNIIHENDNNHWHNVDKKFHISYPLKVYIKIYFFYV